MTLDEGQWMTLSFDIHKGSCTHLVDCIYQLLISQTTIVSEKFIVLPFSHTKNISDQIWPCRKIGQGQPRFIIWTNLVVLDHLMLHNKFQHFGPREDFLRFLHYMGMGRSWSYDQDQLNELSSPHHREAPYEILLWLAQWFQRRICLKSVDHGRLPII